MSLLSFSPARLGRFLPPALRFALACLLLLASGFRATAQIRDGGIDPKNLGKGTWIYIMKDAVEGMNDNVPAITNLTSMMAFIKNQGIRYIVIKAGDEGRLFSPDGNPQFTAPVIQAAHAAGLWVFGYNYSKGRDIPGEVAVANYVFTNGADGCIFDAEIEWETGASSTVGNNGPALATQLASATRSNWPTKFIALSTWGYRGFHSSFPYKEFAYYCDSIMPQDYWVEFGDTASESVTTMNTQWRTWQNGLTGIWTNAIKPFAPTGQGYPITNGPIDAAQITQFFTALKTVANPVTAGGYKGVNFWRAELHPMQVWDAIRTNTIGTVPNTPPTVTNLVVSSVSDTSATIIWTTEQSSDSVIEFGLNTAYGSAVTNTTRLWYHTVTVTGLSPNTTYHFGARSKNANNQTGYSADYVFTTLTAAVGDIVIDENDANNAGGHTVAYSGAWTTTSGSAYLSGFRYASPNYSLGSPTRTARFIPNITVPGNYNVYASWAASSVNGNRATNAPFRVVNATNTVLKRVNEEANGNSFQLIASNVFFPTGMDSYVEAGNDVSFGVGGDIVIADAVKLVYLAPPPSAPAIATQPLAQTVNQGNAVTFSVVASGTGPLAYQWQHASTNLPGATASSFTRNNVQPADAGNYSVTITNIAGITNSALATLTVNTLPVITTQPQSTNVAPSESVTFTVVATASPAPTYQWRFSGTNLPGATGTSFTVNNVQAADTGAYSVLVSNEVAAVVSEDALLALLWPLPPQIEAITLSPEGWVQIQVSGGPGNFAIEQSPSLTGWTQALTTNVAGAVFLYTDGETNQPQRFYRAVRLMP